MPDEWELANGTNPLIADADVDLDSDDYTNFEEYIAGTGPTNAASFLALWAGRTANSGIGLSFAAVSNRSYTIETGGLAGLWQSWTNISANPSNRFISFCFPTK